MKDAVHLNDRPDANRLGKEYAALAEKLKWQTALSSALGSLSKAIVTQGVSDDEMYQMILDSARALTESQHGFVSSVEALTGAHVSNTLTQMRADGCSVPAALSALPQGPHRQYHGLWGHSLNTCKAFFTNAPLSHPASQGLPPGHVSLINFLAAPVIFGGELLGQIALANSKRDYNEYDLEVVEKLAELYAVILQNRRRDDALKRSEARFRSIVEAAPLPMAVTRLADHAILYLNQLGTKLFGLSGDRSAGSSMLNHYVHTDQLLRLAKDVSSNDIVVDRELELCDTCGKPFWALLLAIQIEWYGEPVLLTAFYDITVRRQMEEDLRQLAASHEIAFLQAQIKPHFFYNVLNTIISFCYTDSAKAGRLLAEFSNYLRRSFDIRDTASLITLENELELVKSYVAIEQARFGDRLTVDYDIDPGLLNRRIPPLIIQPLVENAVRHGVMRREEGGQIRIAVRRISDAMRIAVTDDGIGIPSGILDGLLQDGPGTVGVGLRNIDKRLLKFYGTKINIDSGTERGTTVWVEIPANRPESSNAVRRNGSETAVEEEH